MSSTSSGTEDLTDYHEREEGGPRGPDQHPPAARRRRRLAAGATVAGGLLLGAALRSPRGLRRRLSAVVGVALLVVGLRERLGGRDRRPAPERTPEAAPGRPERNPRGTGDEPDVPARTPPDEGAIQFTEHQDEEPRPKPDLEEGPHDPRVDRGDESVTVDLSRAALADEESEAAGPSPEQGYPAQVEDTEPDESPAADVSHVVADQPGPGDWRGNELAGDVERGAVEFGVPDAADRRSEAQQAHEDERGEKAEGGENRGKKAERDEHREEQPEGDVDRGKKVEGDDERGEQAEDDEERAEKGDDERV